MTHINGESLFKTTNTIPNTVPEAFDWLNSKMLYACDTVTTIGGAWI